MEDQAHKIRHSCEHVYAQAIKELYGDKIALAVAHISDDQFANDARWAIQLSEEDFPKIEKKMQQIIDADLPIVRKEVSLEEAKKIFQDNHFKSEWVEKWAAEDKTLTVYQTGDNYVDLCKGPHVERTGQIKAFKLMSMSGAYWRGDEKNEMLTRVYGVAFGSKEELIQYLKNLEEAKKRDHRKLGAELEIFMMDDKVGPGLPLWLPNGAIIVEELERLAKETENSFGYKRVRTPHIAKEELYLTSGHLPYYKDSMYPPMDLDNQKYYLKAMNCPHHHLIYANRPRSYRELPLRLAEYGHCYRYEDSGALFGLMRVRSLCMNDAHIYCTPEQFKAEFLAVIDMYKYYFNLFGIEKYQMRLSLHNQEGLGKKYVDEPELWKQTEAEVRAVMQDSKVPFVEVAGEAAFYGPKIDVQIWSAIGREFTLATNQLDFAVPKRFNLTYIDHDGKEKTPLCIHRAPLSTHERFIGFLLEHYAGAFPAWLAPIQAMILPVSVKHLDYANQVCQKLLVNNIRAEIDDSDEKLGKKIRNAEMKKIPYMLVIGDKEIEAESVAARNYKTKEQKVDRVEDFLKNISEEIKNRLG
ncbi:threonine--tRNA ligase [Candidatus Peregrinibacteria bacterium RIFOXYA12_FULL_33_12]|nr:MAG: threonine--tRNA ligase [Candidatus Peregrinibacteria bacterium RIFOXYA12_FULL_33_12]OGJ44387.1 MAG: threonine--tRNA ligase [Candidatus Peregrinibacteria bacterium RIFOXYA2_FULL_33_21]OGJ50182.1 MAG: threonine--tRNA ligase [Candidatus Peregrinibacteria bacterium RIFOXYB2_FULL_33_20]